ncbi:MAG: UDP-3-O-acyl-N-acetylglucosamine deacetylase [Gemmataceae bacterium]
MRASSSLALDLGPNALVLAHIDHVTGTARRTTIGTSPISVTLVEHVMAALRGLQIDNCVVELDGPEPSRSRWLRSRLRAAAQRCGPGSATEMKTVYAVETTVMVRSGDATLAIHPPKSNEFRISYLLDDKRRVADRPSNFHGRRDA